MPYGYNGKILHVNLNDLSYEVEEPSEEFDRTYEGGGGLTAYYLLKDLKPGTDPLDGLSVQTGIIASADTAGSAIDVCAVNDVVILGDSDAGVSVFNAFNGMNPLAVAQVNTPGSITRKIST